MTFLKLLIVCQLGPNRAVLHRIMMLHDTMVTSTPHYDEGRNLMTKWLFTYLFRLRSISFARATAITNDVMEPFDV